MGQSYQAIIRLLLHYDYLIILSIPCFQSHDIRPEAINVTNREWEGLEESALSTDHDLLHCPACADALHAKHRDGKSELIHCYFVCLAFLGIPL